MGAQQRGERVAAARDRARERLVELGAPDGEERPDDPLGGGQVEGPPERGVDAARARPGERGRLAERRLPPPADVPDA